MQLDELKQAFSGNIILPQDAAYEEARAVFIRKGSPLVVAQVRTPQDVALAIAYAKDNKLVVSVRSGGHSNAGFSTNDGGIVIDVSLLSEVTVIDKEAGRVRVGAGAQWGHIAKTLHPYGLAISAGDTVSVGASGLTLGAGVGWMVRKVGLALDSLVSADIVTADGKLRTVSSDTDPDLFWAIRGGGGNFGVVTALEFIAHPVGDIYFGTIAFAANKPAELLKKWYAYAHTAPEDLTTTALLLPANAMGGQNPPMFMVACCWAGDPSDVDAALQPIRDLGTPVDDDVAKKQYYEVLEEAHVPKGVHIEVNNAFFDDLTAETVDNIVAGYTEHGLMYQIRSVGGAMGRVAPDATAFAHRHSQLLVVAPQFLPEGATEQQIQDALKPWKAIAEQKTGAYINFFSRATQEEVDAAYPPKTYARLAKIKQQYDPKNIFSQNLNIKPSAN